MAGRMNHINSTITVALVILAVLSAGSIVSTAIRSTQGVRAALGVELELSNLELRDGDNPEVVVTFRLENGSPVRIELEVFDVYLYIDSHYIGTSYLPFTTRSINGLEETTMDFVIPILPPHVQFTEQARQKDDFSWLVRGKAKVLFPSFKQQEVWLHVREYWTSE